MGAWAWGSRSSATSSSCTGVPCRLAATERARARPSPCCCPSTVPAGRRRCCDPAGASGSARSLLAPPSQHFPNRRNQTGNDVLLRQEAVRPALARPLRVPLLRVNGQDEDPGVRPHRLDPPGRLEAVEPRHGDVHEHDRRLAVTDILDCRLTIDSFTAHGKVGIRLENLLDDPAKLLMVVYDQNRDRHPSPRSDSNPADKPIGSHKPYRLTCGFLLARASGTKAASLDLHRRSGARDMPRECNEKFMGSEGRRVPSRQKR